MNMNDIYSGQRKAIEERMDLTGKRILEIGCGNGGLLKSIAENDAPEYITGIDLMLSEWWGVGENSGSNWEVRDGDAEGLQFQDQSFDAVISFSTFEHIGDVEKALSEIKRVLKPFGRFYTSFTPLWTSVAGHHFVAQEDEFWRKEHLSLIPPWGHLYMSERQMLEHLQTQTEDQQLVNDIVSFIYHSTIINRRSRTFLMNAIMNCGMIVREYRETVGFNRLINMSIKEPSEMTDDIRRKAVANGYDIRDLGIAGMQICLEKYSDL